MSTTPGWTEKSIDEVYGKSIAGSYLIRSTQDHYFLDNGTEYKEFPGTKEGWIELCDALKEFFP